MPERAGGGYVQGIDQILSLRLAPATDSPRRARRAARAALVGTAGPELLDAVLLIVSELITNAGEHAGTPAELTLTLYPGHVRVAVHDDDPTVPTFGRPPSSGHGRGLRIVQALGGAVGVDREAGGKTIWVEVPIDAEP